MRVSTNMIYQSIIKNLSLHAENLLSLQEKVSTGKEVNRPKDDPIGSKKILNYRSQLNSLKQYNTNLNQGKAWLGLTETSLMDLTDLIRNAKDIAITQSSDTADALSRESSSEEVSGIVNSIIQNLNGKFTNRYLFSGHKTLTHAFSLYDKGAIYNGDFGITNLQISSFQKTEINIIGSRIFPTSVTDLGEMKNYSTQLHKETAGFAYSYSKVNSGFVFVTGTNDQIVFNDGVDHVVSVTDSEKGGLLNSGKVYSGSQVASALKKTLERENNGDDTYTVTYDVVANRFNVTNDSGNTNTITLKWDDAQTTAEGTLGFNNSSADTLSVGNQVSGDNAVAFNVITGVNDRLNVSIDGTAASGEIVITSGNYLATELATEIQTRINADALISGVTVSYDPFQEIFVVNSPTKGANSKVEITSGSNDFLSTIHMPPISVDGEESTSLSLLNEGRGVMEGKIKITDTYSNSVVIDLSTSTTIQDVIDAINAQAGVGLHATFTASFSDDKKGLKLTDGSGGGNILVEEAGAKSTTAQDLGIAGIAAGNTLTGKELKPDISLSTPIQSTFDGNPPTLGSFKIENGSLSSTVNLSDVRVATSAYVASGSSISSDFVLISGTNNVLRVTDSGGGPVDVDIIAGSGLISGNHYTGAQIAAGIQTALNANGTLSGTYTVTYDDTEKTFSISSNDAATNIAHTSPASTISSTLGYTGDDSGVGPHVSDKTVAFNVLTGVNDAFQIGIDNQTVTAITITAGTYTASSLKNEINTRMSNQGLTGFTVSYTGNMFAIKSSTTGADSKIVIASGANDFLTTVNISPATSNGNEGGNIGDIINKIDNSETKVKASLNSNNNGIKVTSLEKGRVLEIFDFNGGRTAENLGISGIRDILDREMTSLGDNSKLNPAMNLNSSGYTKSTTVPTSYFVFKDGVNEVINFNDGVARTADLIDNSSMMEGEVYTGQQVAEFIKQAIETQNGTDDEYNVTYSSDTGKFTIENPAGNNNITLNWSNPGSTATTYLGFLNSADDIVLNGDSTSSDNPVNFVVLTNVNDSFLASADGINCNASITITQGAYSEISGGSSLSSEIETRINADTSLNPLPDIRVSYVNGEGYTITSGSFGENSRVILTPDPNSTIDFLE
ncbi:MAG: flagellar hook-associated protein FlgL, partial [Thermodesulfobacteriota bacterium]|nr:flagellar hook-associated protein FlgL [Thermodesulfobacteriota bacterium]